MADCVRVKHFLISSSWPDRAVPSLCWCCWSFVRRAVSACWQRCKRDRGDRPGGAGGGRPEEQQANMAEVLRSLLPRASPKSTLEEAALALTTRGLGASAVSSSGAPVYEHETGFFSGELGHLSFLSIEDA